jgi:membrane-associated phospholipid phosphatase
MTDDTTVDDARAAPDDARPAEPAEREAASEPAASEPAASPAADASPPKVPLWRDPLLLTWTRWCAIAVWAVAFGHECYVNGAPFDREGLILWIMFGAAAATIGKRAIWTVVVDFLPFALVLIAYDYARGFSDKLGMPTWWRPQIDVDKAIFGGIEPTVWLQEHLKHRQAQWWDVVVTVTYISFFFLPYVTAGVLWVRSRSEFHRWAGRFVGLSFLGFALFALIPAAPPWAAAQCAADEIASHPANPSCMGYSSKYTNGGILGQMTQHVTGANPWIERISGRGFGYLHLGVAKSLLDKGQGTVDLVAAVPSLHAGGTMLFVLFFWRQSNKWIRSLLALYAVVMAFALVYSAEHYFSDVLAGWLCAALVMIVAGRIERWRKRAKSADRLDDATPTPPTASRMENPQCPPIETTP